MSDTQPPKADRKQHPFYTYDMIFEIPQSIADTLRNMREKTSKIAAKINNGKRCHFTGCGTAFFSSMLGAQVIQLNPTSNIESACIQALEFQTYKNQISKSDVTIAISHSGITKTTVDALNLAKMKGSYCAAITHFDKTPLSQVAHETIIVGNSPDKSKCHTKCYVASAIACTKLLLEAVKGNQMSERLTKMEKEIERLPETISRVLTDTDPICKKIANELSGTDYYFAGAGPNYPNALEAALKILETSFVPALGLQTEQLMHGPWVALDKESVVVLLAPKGDYHKRNLELAKAAHSLKVPLISIVEKGDEEFSTFSNHVIQVPQADEYLSPYLNIIPLYLLSYYSSLRRGHNPDMLRYETPEYWGARQIIFPLGTH